MRFIGTLIMCMTMAGVLYLFGSFMGVPERLLWTICGATGVIGGISLGASMGENNARER